jgi:hypothetical protein
MDATDNDYDESGDHHEDSVRRGASEALYIYNGISRVIVIQDADMDRSFCITYALITVLWASTSNDTFCTA